MKVHRVKKERRTSLSYAPSRSRSVSLAPPEARDDGAQRSTSVRPGDSLHCISCCEWFIMHEYVPVISHIRSPIPERIPTTPICPSGFWSNHSTTNSRAYCSMRSKRVGRISRSSIALERSSSSTKCRMIVRRIAVEGACRLHEERNEE